MFQLDSPFGYQDANAIKKLWANTTAPAAPGTGEVWLEVSVTPNRLKRWNGATWEVIVTPTSAEILTSLLTVDGINSQLDADVIRGNRIEIGQTFTPYKTVTPVTVPFSTAFSSVPTVIVSGGPDAESAFITYATVKTVTTTSFQMIQQAASPRLISWLAFGAK